MSEKVDYLKRVDEYVKLVKKVEAIDPVAAHIMRNQVVDLPTFHPASQLSSVFVWSEIEEAEGVAAAYRDRRYWGNLAIKLDKIDGGGL